MTAQDPRLCALVELAKRMPSGETARRDAASFARFEARLEERRPRRWSFRSRRVWLAGSLGMAALALLAVLRGSPSEQARTLTYRVEASIARGTTRLDAPKRLAFSDGSHVTLDDGGEARVNAVTSHGASVSLLSGSVEVAIAKRKNAAWLLQAGPYTVRVTGTAFRLTWSSETEQVEVGMRHGSVVVTGPLAPDGVALHAGQRLLASSRDRRLVVEDWPRRRAPEVAVASAPSRPEQPVAAGDARSPARSSSSPPSPSSPARGTVRFDAAARDNARMERNWAKKVAQGDFVGVLREARALGLPRVLENAALSDLGALADAARYARQSELGQKALLVLRERFPDSEIARDSAFLLGRMSSERSALRWYERYLSEQPDGVYISQALGRSMMLCYEQGESERARSLATRYLERFADGPYAASARKLVLQVRVDHSPP